MRGVLLVVSLREMTLYVTGGRGRKVPEGSDFVAHCLEKVINAIDDGQ